MMFNYFKIQSLSPWLLAYSGGHRSVSKEPSAGNSCGAFSWIRKYLLSDLRSEAESWKWPSSCRPCGYEPSSKPVAALNAWSHSLSFGRPGKEDNREPFPHWLCGICRRALWIFATSLQLGSLLMTVLDKWTDSYIYHLPRVGECLFAWVFDSWLIKWDSE